MRFWFLIFSFINAIIQEVDSQKSFSVPEHCHITLPADFTIFSSLAIVAQGGSTGATQPCSQGPSEEPVSRPGSKIE